MGKKQVNPLRVIIPDDPLTKALERPEVQEALTRAWMEAWSVQKPSPERHSSAGGD